MFNNKYLFLKWTFSGQRSYLNLCSYIKTKNTQDLTELCLDSQSKVFFRIKLLSLIQTKKNRSVAQNCFLWLIQVFKLFWLQCMGINFLNKKWTYASVACWLKTLKLFLLIISSKNIIINKGSRNFPILILYNSKLN